MARDPEKEDLEASQHVPQDLDGPFEHPGISTTKDGEEEPSFANEDLSSKHEDQTSKHETDTDSIHTHSSIATAPDPAQLERPPVTRSKSRSSSTRSRPIVLIPSAERRGLLGRFTIVAEVENPYFYSRRTKWFITFLVALAAAAAPMGSAILLREFIRLIIIIYYYYISIAIKHCTPD